MHMEGGEVSRACETAGRCGGHQDIQSGTVARRGAQGSRRCGRVVWCGVAFEASAGPFVAPVRAEKRHNGDWPQSVGSVCLEGCCHRCYVVAYITARDHAAAHVTDHAPPPPGPALSHLTALCCPAGCPWSARPPCSRARCGSGAEGAGTGCPRLSEACSSRRGGGARAGA